MSTKEQSVCVSRGVQCCPYAGPSRAVRQWGRQGSSDWQIAELSLGIGGAGNAINTQQLLKGPAKFTAPNATCPLLQLGQDAARALTP